MGVWTPVHTWLLRVACASRTGAPSGLSRSASPSRAVCRDIQHAVHRLVLRRGVAVPSSFLHDEMYVQMYSRYCVPYSHISGCTTRHMACTVVRRDRCLSKVTEGCVFSGSRESELPGQHLARVVFEAFSEDSAQALSTPLALGRKANIA